MSIYNTQNNSQSITQSKLIDPDNLPIFGAISPETAFTELYRHLRNKIKYFGTDPKGNSAISKNGDLLFWFGHLPGLTGHYFCGNLYDPLDVRSRYNEVGDTAIKYRAGLSKSHIRYVSAFPFEADHASIESQIQSINEFVAATGLLPTLLTLSGDRREESIKAAQVQPERVVPGKSVHGFFVSDRLLDMGVEDDVKLFDDIQRHLVVVFGSDSRITNPDRLMRTSGVLGYNSYHEETGPVRIQTSLYAQNHPYPPEVFLQKLQSLLAARGVTDVDLAFDAISEAERMEKVASKTNETERGMECLDLAKTLRKNLTINDEQRELADLLDDSRRSPSHVKAEKTGSNPINTKGESIPGSTPVRLADGTTTTVEQAASSLTAGGSTLSVFCPFHMNTNTPSASLGLTPNGSPFIHCFSCEEFWFVSDADQYSIKAPPSSHLASCSRYLPPINLQKAFTIIAADTGTGKTYQLQKLIQDNPQHKRILAIVHRVSLARSLSKEFGLVCYQDLQEGDIIEDRVVICLDSITRIPPIRYENDQWVGNGFDLVIIEESESVMLHMDGGTIPKSARGYRANTGEVYDHLSLLLKASVMSGGRIIATDGFASDFTENVIRDMAGLTDQDIDVIQHSIPLDDHESIEYKKKEDIVYQVIQKLNAGERCVVACTSKEYLKGLERFFRKWFFDITDKTSGESRPIAILAYHKETDDSTRKMLSNVGEHWKEVDLLMYTPTLDTGISYDPSDPSDRFDHLFFIGERVAGMNVRTLLQMRHRCREMKTIHYWISPGFRNYQPLNLKDVEKQLLSVHHHTSRFAGRFLMKGGKPVYDVDDSAHFRFSISAELYRRKGWHNVPAVWKWWWESKGAKQSEATPTSDANRRWIRREIQDLRNQTDKEYAISIAMAEPLTLDEYGKLKIKREKTPEEKLEVERARILGFFGEVDADLVLMDKDRNLSKKIMRIIQCGLMMDRLRDAATYQDQMTMLTGYRAHSKAHTLRMVLVKAIIQTLLCKEFADSLFAPLLSNDNNTLPNCKGAVPRDNILYIFDPAPLHPSLTIQWNKHSLVAGGGIERVNRVMGKVPNALYALQGTGINMKQLESNPVAVLGKCFQFFGLKTHSEQKSVTVNGKTARPMIYNLDIEHWEQMMTWSKRMNKVIRGDRVVHFDSLESPPPVIVENEENIEINIIEILKTTGTDG